MKANGKPRPERAPTPQQLEAIDLLAAGKTIKETADQLGIPLMTVSRWRLYDPVFQAAMNQWRADIWSAGIDRLRSLVPKALDVLAQELDRQDSPNRCKAASQILQLVKPTVGATPGPTDPEEILRIVAKERWDKLPNELDSLRSLGRPNFEGFVETTRRDLDTRLNAPQ
jgi:hypothetical protein